MLKLFDTKNMIPKPQNLDLDQQLILACSDQKTFSLDKIKQLVAEGADVNARDKTGKTPLHHLAVFTQSATDAMSFLLEKGANLEARDLFGEKAYLVDYRAATHHYLPENRYFRENKLFLLKISDERKAMRLKIQDNNNESTNNIIHQENAQRKSPTPQ